MGAPPRCSGQAARCSDFSCCGAGALGTQASVVVACVLSSYGAWFSSSPACGLYLPGRWQVDSYLLYPPGYWYPAREILKLFFKVLLIMIWYYIIIKSALVSDYLFDALQF